MPAGQLSRLWVEHDHTRFVGDLVALERDDAGLWATFVSSAITLLRDREPWFLSAEVRHRQDGADAHDARLEGAALVRNPGATCTRPVLILIGRLDRETDRKRWRLPSPAKERVERAAYEQRHRRLTDPVMVRDHTRERERFPRHIDEIPREALPQLLGDDRELLRSDLGLPMTVEHARSALCVTAGCAGVAA